ncbi:DUF1415 family protein [Neolewinella antarctica]|uniref:DUF1415 domain-containing protein n=1 Tax=Neolewinella antarctica TaxID=442734 RepID=A0ABX0XCC3_9BACT|nr:DUF1415 domain-containing protein [Neolewinella antarctica]NJC26911.1 hypothetical protein [Neolewinella antarctica]
MEETSRWVEEFVIKHGLCPFAARPFREGRVTFEQQPSDDIETCFNWALSRVRGLLEKEPGEVETSLLIFPNALADFGEFLDFVETFEEVLAEAGANELVQLAHFHPGYQFADVPADDAGNLTNQAPHPVVQLLRVATVASAVAEFPDVAQIPERNIRTLRKLFRK